MFSLPKCVIWFTVGVTEAVVIVTVNLLTTLVFLRNRKLRQRSNSMYLVFSLTVADMLAGGIFILQILRNMRSWNCDFVNLNLEPNSYWELGILFFITYLFPVVSLTNTAAISLERMHATFRSYSHRAMKTYVYKVTITTVWVLAAVVSAVSTTVLLIWKTKPYHFYVWQSFNCLCLFFICVSYASIIAKLRCGVHPQHHGAAREKKLTVTLFIVTFLSLLLWLPYAVGSFIFITTYSFRSLSFMMELNYALVFLFYANFLINPILYTIRMPEFRKLLFKLFRRQQR